MSQFPRAPRRGLDGPKVTKIGKGLAIAVAGAVLTYLATVIPGVDFGGWTPLVTAGFAAIVNAFRQWSTPS